MPGRKTCNEYINSVFTLKFLEFLGFFGIYVYIEYP